MMKFGYQILCSRCYLKLWNGSSGNFMKKFHTSKLIMVNKLPTREIKIPVPWGHIAGKWWGSPDVQPVLALHGVQDNAATFDTLVPLLGVDAVFAPDLPGHGQSSHLPRGFPYDYTDAVCILRFMVKYHFNWSEPLVLLGHSFGSNLSLVYAALFPDQVSKFISLDCSRHQMAEYADTMIASMRNTIDNMLRMEEKTKPPEYTEDELLEMTFQGRGGSKGWISKEGCKTLLSRGTTKLPNGKVHLSRDPKLKLNAFGRLTPDSWVSLASRLTCDMLSIQAEKGVVKNDHKGELYKKTVDIILEKNSKSKHIILPGHHHVHLDNPQVVAKEINQFLSS